ncbi:hypothetical protein CY652_09205 [Burkholderia sp. WAC0059]|uniref:diguanylate cyclase n=1 Tax=Burkholderia sp. WAC0059 TaxID=2066022 RepID=UPI000C7ED448|nr:diguanylate cyclase [Burkholderia sp. WAC0059]PLZ02702.1 hypothetical protein CY652_09205 [Burkholderia sp. WAC0059]
MDHPDIIGIASLKPETEGISMEQMLPADHNDLQIASVVNALRTPACYFNRDGQVVSINDAWAIYAGLPIDAIGQLQWVELIHAEHRYDAILRLRGACADLRHETLECRLVNCRGDGRWFIVNFHGIGTGWLCTCTDIHCLKSRERELKSQERICIGNRDRSTRFCVVLIDIDHFKIYNDMYGHSEGDRALCLVAMALKKACRQSDVVARYGGEEFMIIGRHVTNPSPLLENVGLAVRQLRIPHSGSPVGYITISCGCVVFAAGENDFSASWLIKQSDEALYEVKSEGRDRYVVRNIDR